jgi:hypothetical protein
LMQTPQGVLKCLARSTTRSRSCRPDLVGSVIS